MINRRHPLLFDGVLVAGVDQNFHRTLWRGRREKSRLTSTVK